MVKVCHITTEHDPYDDRIFYKECVSLSEKYDVYLVQPGDSCRKLNVNIVGTGKKPRRFLYRIFFYNFSVYIKALKLGCQIYHIHDPELLIFAIFLKIRKKIVIFDSHEFYSIQLKSKYNNFKLLSIILSKTYSFIEKFVLRQIDAVIAVCTIDGKNYFKNKCKICEYICNATILDEFYNNFSKKIYENNNNICYIGGLSNDRGIENCVIAAKNANVNLILAGKFSDENYYNKIKSMNEYDSVEYKGIVDRKGVYDILNLSKIGLNVLLDEGQYLRIDTFGVKVYEYLSMGLPVIFSHSKYNDRMVKKYNFGLTVNPNSIEELTYAIKFIINNNDIAKKMSDNARKFILNHNWNNEKNKLFNLYQKLLKKY